MTADQDRLLLGVARTKEEVFRLAEERVRGLGADLGRIEPRELHLDVFRTKSGDAYRLWIERSVLDRYLAGS